ncbi:MAG: EI24 domain-containing protein [Myxococcota bacterium]|nr:EI24 domain-containing protein [Myxococcota bacterium]
MTSSDVSPSLINASAGPTAWPPIPKSAFSAFLLGFSLLGKSLAMLLKEPKLRRHALWPILISTIVFCIMTLAAIFGTIAAIHAIWPEPPTGWLLIFYWVFVITTALLVGLLAYALFLVASAAASSIFSERLSEELEHMLMGTTATPSSSSQSFFGAFLDSVKGSLSSLLRLLLIALASLALHLVPVLGSVLSLFFTWSAGAYFISQELIDATAQRHGYSPAARRKLVLSNKALFLGMGSGLLLLALLPLANFLTVPLGVMAGTQAFLRLTR